MRRTLLVVAVAVLLALAGQAVVAAPDAPNGPDAPDDPDALHDFDTADATLEIHHVDVGQADATLLIEPGGETMLIDSGDWHDDGAAMLEYLEALGIDRIDHLVATHGHADHVGGHAAVIEHFETSGDGVGAAYDSGVAHDTATFERYLDAIEAHDVDLFVVEEGDELAFGDADVTFLNPPGSESGTDTHYNGVALTVTLGELTYLTTGDAEADAEERMAEAHGDALDADVYQAGHHGSSTSSSPEFLDAVDPDHVVISSAYESQYDHPHDEVLERFAARGYETYWTGVHGHVIVTIDGTSIDVDTQHDAPIDPAALVERTPDDDSSADALRSSGDERRRSTGERLRGVDEPRSSTDPPRWSTRARLIETPGASSGTR